VIDSIDFSRKRGEQCGSIRVWAGEVHARSGKEDDRDLVGSPGSGMAGLYRPGSSVEEAVQHEVVAQQSDPES